MTSTHIFCIIVYKFRYQYKSILVILISINKYLVFGYYYIILSLCLAIYQRIKSGKELVFDIKEVV